MCSDGGPVLAPFGVPAGAVNEARVHAASSLLAHESVVYRVMLSVGHGNHCSMR